MAYAVKLKMKIGTKLTTVTDAMNKFKFGCGNNNCMSGNTFKLSLYE